MTAIGISVESAIVMTEQSRRTWWRRIAAGEVTRVADDARGRAMLSWPNVVPKLCVPMNSVDLSFALRADAGEADAQNDIGQLFLNAGKHAAALYWLRMAAQQDNADAMQCLGRCYLNGQGLPKDENLGLMWIAKAAAYGHVIAQAQMKSLGPR